jgi:hypothetical protein
MAPKISRCRVVGGLISRLSTWSQIAVLPTEPAIQVTANEIVVVQMRIRGIDAIYFLRLTRAESLVGIETPDAIEQAPAS